MSDGGIYVEGLEVPMDIESRLLREAREERRRGWARKPVAGTMGIINLLEGDVPRPADAEVQLMRFSRGAV